MKKRNVVKNEESLQLLSGKAIHIIWVRQNMQKGVACNFYNYLFEYEIQEGHFCCCLLYLKKWMLIDLKGFIGNDW